MRTREAREAVRQPKPGRVGADVNLGDHIVAFDRLDHRAARAGESHAAVGDHPHDGVRVEARRRYRLLHLDHRLEELGIQPHRLLGQLALGDVELGAEVADLPAGVVPQRLPGAGAPPELPGAGHHPILLVAERSALRQKVPLGGERRTVVGVDVLEELLVPEVLLGVPGEPLEGRIHEGEAALHVVGDHALAHGAGDGAEVSRGVGGRAARPTPLRLQQRRSPRATAAPPAPGRRRRWRAVPAECRRSDQRALRPRIGILGGRFAPRIWRTFRRQSVEGKGLFEELGAGLEHAGAGRWPRRWCPRRRAP